MHNMAIALYEKGIVVTGSDDEIFEPSKTRLQKRGLLPVSEGWFPEKISAELDAVIVGMHARKDNPELLRAQELGLRIFSYPEYIYEQTKNKTRVVIGGSHGKTTTTAMILHVAKHSNVDCDFLVGAQLEGFDCMVRFTRVQSLRSLKATSIFPHLPIYAPSSICITPISLCLQALPGIISTCFRRLKTMWSSSRFFSIK